MKKDTGSIPALPFQSQKWGQFVSYEKTLPFVCSDDYIPRHKTGGAAGFDLCASECIVIPAKGSATVNTGLQMQIAPEHYGKIEGRSGLGFRHLVMPFGGIIDSDYRGEIKVLLFNHSDVEYDVKIGHAIAQLIIHRYETPTLFRVDTLEDNNDGGFGSIGDGGFGSTGI